MKTNDLLDFMRSIDGCRIEEREGVTVITTDARAMLSISGDPIKRRHEKNKEEEK